MIKFNKKKFTGDNLLKRGLILEGGAMRGLFSSGVMDVLMENRIEFDGTIGVSAGAAFGCNFKSKQPGRVIRYNTAYAKDPRFCSIRSFIKTGNMFGADFCYYEIPDKLDLFDKETFGKNPMDFYVVATDIITGKAVYRNCEKINRDTMEWIRASASMPLASRIVEVGGYKLLDGGISDSIPIKFFESIGYDKNLLILTQPKDYQKSANNMMPLIKLRLGKYKGLIEAMEKRHIVYNDTLKYINEKEERKEVFVIRPEEALPIGHIEHNADNMRRVYEIGRSIALKHIEEIKKFLS